MKRFYQYGPPCSLELKDLNLKDRIVQAYYFNAQTIDSDSDIISIDAYEKSIKERGPKSALPRIKHLFNHWEGAGVIQELGKDEKGGWFMSKLGRHTVGRDTLLMYEDGLITEHSHGFDAVNTSNETIEGKEIRRIKEAVLWEVTSLDKWGANMNTPVIKSIDDQQEWIKKLDRLQKALNRGSYTDETFDLFEIQLKQIMELLQNYEMEQKPFTNFHAARVRDPDDFVRIRVLQTLPNGIMIYGGPLKSDPQGSTKPQTYRFPKDKFTVAEAKKWLTDHDIKYISFEPAEEEEPKQLPTLRWAGSLFTPKQVSYDKIVLTL